MKKTKILAAVMAVSISVTLLFSACSSGALKDNETEGSANSFVTEDANGLDGCETGEGYLVIDQNSEKSTLEESMITFSLKVDTASYTNAARYIRSGNLPPADAVRTEEFLNYFSYDGEMVFGSSPFAVSAEVASSPFDSNKHIAFIRVKTSEIETEDLPRSNLTFLIDTSGSMDSYDKLPLLKEAFSMLVENLGENDKVSIVTYAGSSAVVLDSTSGNDRERILSAINNLEAGGSTAGADGINTAYSLAEKNFIQGANNRIILATDGDFNVGISDLKSLERLISEKRDKGIYLSLLGFGTGNIKDDTMETLSKNGNGNYGYINTRADGEKFLVNEMGSNLFTVADDVKAQVEFNPQNVKNYRLIGYENRRMSNDDFSNDKKDAGEIGAGSDVVMMFEFELGSADGGKKYSSTETAGNDFADELFEVRIRYKNPGENESKLVEVPVYFEDIKKNPGTDFRFACSVMGFAELLRNSEYLGNMGIDKITAMAEDNLGSDPGGYRRAYLELLKDTRRILG